MQEVGGKEIQWPHLAAANAGKCSLEKMAICLEKSGGGSYNEKEEGIMNTQGILQLWFRETEK